MEGPVHAVRWDGLEMSCRAELRGGGLEPKWALVRARDQLEEDGASPSGEPGDAGAPITFDEPLARISMTGAFIPYDIAGTIRAVQDGDTLTVTATADTSGTLWGWGISVVCVTGWFAWRQMGFGGFYCTWESLVTAVTAFHLWQTAHALKRMTAAAIAL